MANVNAPFGLRASRHLRGGVVRLADYRIADQLSTSIFSGDLVKSTGTGKKITQSAATDTSVGVFYGCEYTDSQGNIVFSRYWPASTVTKAGTEIIAWVYDDPDTLFTVQGGSTGVAAVDVGQSADIVVGTGSTATGSSAGVLSNTISTSKMLHIYELTPADDNAYGAYARVNVLINKHELRGVLSDV